MEITILLDHDLEGYDVFLIAGLAETGWDQLLKITFKRLRDFHLPDDYPDQEIWRFAQARQMLILTNNRNGDSETSLQVTIRRENTPEALPVVTVSNKNALALPDYRQRVATGLAAILLYPEESRGTGRIYVP